jgi:hypothetical protein
MSGPGLTVPSFSNATFQAAVAVQLEIRPVDVAVVTVTTVTSPAMRGLPGDGAATSVSVVFTVATTKQEVGWRGSRVCVCVCVCEGARVRVCEGAQSPPPPTHTHT